MKIKLYTTMLLFLVCFILNGCAAKEPEKTPLEEAGAISFVSNVELSSEAENPPVNDSVQTIALTFSEEIDPATLDGAVLLSRINSKGAPVEAQCRIAVDTSNKNRININTAGVTSFAKGEEYKLEISKSLTSVSGAVLDKNYTGYFATNNIFHLPDTADATALNNERNQIVVLSDIHLGVDDTFAEFNKNRQALVNFLGQVKNSPDIAELVIAGDLLDEWFLPMDYEMPDTGLEFFKKVAVNNKTVIDALNGIIKEGKIKVTYTPGNHDLLLTASDLESILPGINQARDKVQGLGTYMTGQDSQIAVEHGHRYNIFCAPDMISNRKITKNNTSILPCGYFFTRIATSSVLEGMPASKNVLPEITPNKEDETQFNNYLYYETWKGLLSSLPVNESFSDKVIKTNIDGFTETYAVNDFIPQQGKNGTLEVNLYQGMADTWDERQTNNGVKVKLSAKDAIIDAASTTLIDLQSKTQYFDLDASKRIVIFGHTHEARILPMKNLENQKTIYANSGTWIDNAQNFPSRTFVVVTPAKADSAITTVNIYQYSEDRTVTQWQKAEAITD